MKKIKHILAVILSVLLIVSALAPMAVSAAEEPQTKSKNRVVGYFPSYKFQYFENIDFSAMTHCILSFLTYNNGKLTCGFTDEQIKAVKEKCDRNGVKLMVALGGWEGFQYTDNPVDTAEERTKLVAELMYYVDTYDLDGIDIDVEITDGVFWSNFDPFIAELSAELKADNKLLSMAVATWFTDPIANSTYDYFDFINLMSYYGTDDSTVNHIYTYLKYYGDRGISDDRMVIGVPFFGNFNNINPTYGEIITASKDASMTNSFNGVSYNGMPAITAKAEIALNYGGIMIWEVAQDSFERRYSLLEAIKRVNDQTGTATEIGYLSGLSDINIACDSVSLGWDTYENAEKYNLYYDGRLVGTTSDTSFTVTGLTEGTEYIFTVNAVNSENGIMATSSLLLTTSVNADGIPDWDAATFYREGDRVVFEGAVYEAQWRTHNYEPANLGVWRYIGKAGVSKPDPDIFVFKLENKEVLCVKDNIKLTVDSAVKYREGKTLVPLRIIAAAAGIDDLKFNSDDSTITFTGFDGYKVEMTLNSTLCTITKGSETVDVAITAPVTIGGVTMLPLRDTAALIGGCVKYDNSGYVVVSSKEIPDSDIPGYIAAYNNI